MFFNFFNFLYLQELFRSEIGFLRFRLNYCLFINSLVFYFFFRGNIELYKSLQRSLKSGLTN